MTDHARENRAVWAPDAPIRLPSLARLWREWRCSRKHEHGPGGFYHPSQITSAHGASETYRIWMQECQACGRFTVWGERRGTTGGAPVEEGKR